MPNNYNPDSALSQADGDESLIRFNSFHIPRLNDLLASWALRRPALMREVISAQLSKSPVRKLGSTVLVLGHPEALAVLERHDDFQLAETVRDRFMTGPFILNMEQSARYNNDKAQLKQGFYEGEYDLTAEVASFSRQYIGDTLDELLENDECIDVVGDLAEKTATQVVLKFLIGPASDKQGESGLDEREFIKNIRQLSKLVISLNPQDPRLRRKCRESSHYLKKLVEQRVEDVKKSKNVSGDAISHLIDFRIQHGNKRKGGMPDEHIISSISGMAIAGIGNIAAATGKSLNELLHRERELRTAQRQVMDLNGKPDRRRALALSYALEALRFNPVFPTQTRHCVRDTSIETAHGEIVKIKAGSSVMVLAIAAMQDSRIFPDPRRFLIGRPAEKYLFFGHGMHVCFGKALAEIQIGEIMAALLGSGRKIERVSGSPEERHPQYDGPYLHKLMVRMADE